jgi:hypothetical protein
VDDLWLAERIDLGRDAAWLQDEDTQDPGTQAGKRFRLKLRAPYPLFEYIFDKCHEVNLEMIL